MNFEDFINSLKVNSDELYDNFFSTSNTHLPSVEKNIQGTRKSFKYNLDYSIELLQKYHKWLTQHYDLKPKH